MRKHDFVKLGDRLARELGRITGHSKQAEQARNIIRNRYQWYSLQASVDEMQASPNRFCIVPFDVEVRIDPQVEATGTLIDLCCGSIQRARFLACQIARRSKQSWKLYRGKEWVDVILYSTELNRAIAVEASLTAVARELYGCALKTGSTNDLNQGKSYGNH